MQDVIKSWTVAFAGAREACGAPVLVLGASYIGFGSLVRQSGLDVWHGVFSTFSAWALPGQIALVELYSVGASLAAISLAVTMTNLRLLPMTMSLMPMLHARLAPRWPLYLVAHLIAVTGWAAAMQRCPSLPVEQRLPWFVGFTTALWLSTLLCTAAGFFFADWVPGSVSLGLVFLNPVYFMLLFAADLRVRARALALGLGAVAGPILHMVDPRWGLVVTGFAAGTAAFLLDRWMTARTARRNA